MSHVIFNRSFASTWKRIEPYLRTEHPSPELFNTAYKALYLFLCSITNRGLDTQIKAIQLEHETNRDVDFLSESQKMEQSIQQSLHVMHSLHQEGKRIDHQFTVNEIAKLKQQADNLMKIEIGCRWKFCAFCCPCFWTSGSKRHLGPYLCWCKAALHLRKSVSPLSIAGLSIELLVFSRDCFLFQCPWRGAKSESHMPRLFARMANDAIGKMVSRRLR